MLVDDTFDLLILQLMYHSCLIHNVISKTINSFPLIPATIHKLTYLTLNPEARQRGQLPSDQKYRNMLARQGVIQD